MDVEILDESSDDERKEIVIPHGLPHVSEAAVPPQGPSSPRVYVPPQGPASPRVYVPPPVYVPPHVPVEMKENGPMPPPPAAPPAIPGEAWARKPDLLNIFDQWLKYDALEQKMVRQQSGVSPLTRAMYNPSSHFNPVQAPQLAPIVNPRALEEQIQNIVGKFEGVKFDEEAINSRKAFLARVDKQGNDLLAQTQRKISIWHRQKIEYQSLAEYDAEVQRLRAEKRTAETMMGEKRKRRRQNDMEED